MTRRTRRNQAHHPWADAPSLLAWVIAPLQLGLQHCEHLTFDTDGTLLEVDGHASFFPAISPRVLCDPCLEATTTAYVAVLDAGLPAWTCAVCATLGPLQQFRGHIRAGFAVIAWFCPSCVSAARGDVVR